MQFIHIIYTVNNSPHRVKHDLRKRTTFLSFIVGLNTKALLQNSSQICAMKSQPNFPMHFITYLILQKSFKVQPTSKQALHVVTTEDTQKAFLHSDNGCFDCVAMLTMKVNHV
jgi:hypothetical protein